MAFGYFYFFMSKEFEILFQLKNRKLTKEKSLQKRKKYNNRKKKFKKKLGKKFKQIYILYQKY